MPRMPDEFSLPQAVPHSEESPQTYQAGGTEQAAYQFGQKLVGLGVAVDKGNYYEGQLQSAYAKSAVITKQAALEEQIKNNPYDPEAQENYRAAMKDIINNESQSISDPYHKNMFNDYANKVAYATGDLRVNGMVQQKRRGAALGSLEQLTEDQISTGLKNPDMSVQAIQNIQQATDATVKIGAMDQAHATLFMQKTANRFAEAKLQALPPDQQIMLLKPMVDRMNGVDGNSQSNNQQAANQNIPGSNSDDTIKFVMDKFEGDHYVANDGGHGPSKYGVVGKWNGLTDNQVKNLTPEKAASILKENYYDQIVTPDMTPQMKLVSFDTAVNFGVPAAQHMIDKSDGDPQALLNMRSGFHHQLSSQNPERYGEYSQGWQSRDTILKQAVNSVGSQGQKGDWSDYLNPEKVPLYYEQAQSHMTRQQVGFRAGLEQRVKDSVTMASVGQDIPNIPKMADFLSAYPPDEAAMKYTDFARNVQFGKDYNALAGATPAQQQDIIDRNLPVVGDGFDAQQKHYDQLVQTADQVNKARMTDPIQFGKDQGLVDSKPLDFNDPQAFTKQLTSRFNAASSMSQSFGTPVMPFSKAEATGISTALDNMPAQGKLSFLSSIKQSTVDPNAYRAAIQQIRPNSPVTAMAGAFLALPGSTANQGGWFSGSDAAPFSKVAEQLVKGEDLLNPSKGDKGDEGKGHFPMPPDAKMQASFQTYVGDAFRGYPQQQHEAYLSYKANYAAITADKGMAAEMLDDGTSQTSLHQIIGVVDKSGSGHVIVPPGIDASTFRDQAKVNFESTMTAHGFDPKKWSFSDIGLQNTGTSGVYRLTVGSQNLLDKDGNPVTLAVGNNVSHPSQ